jgi:predicted nucleic acid-binding protein
LRFVFDSTPLIHLVKAGLAWTIEELEGEKYVVPSVYAEVVEAGKAKGFNDAFVSEELIRKGAIAVKKPSRGLVRLIAAHRDIHLGEAEVISLAKELKAVAIIDDPVARSIADMHGVRKEGSHALILRMLRDGKIEKDGAKEALRKLVASGWRCEVELYEKMLKAIEDF